MSYLQQRDGIVPVSDLLRDVWGYAPQARTHTVQTTIQRVRLKIETNPSRPKLLLTIRGRGYQLIADAHQGPTKSAGLTNIDLPATTFVGRKSEQTALTSMCERGARFLTLRGGPGVGKTRLATQWASQRLGAHHDGIWFCDVSEAETSMEFLSALATTFEITQSGDEDTTIEALQTMLQCGPNRLWVIDNFEQLDTTAAVLLAKLVQQFPALHVLVTSRRRLAVEGETVLALSPLSEDEAQDLLLERMSTDAEDRDGPHLQAIANLLEGVPLALEMAAAQTRVLSLEGLASRLQNSLSALRLDRESAPGRQQTMAKAVEWSWLLLSSEERKLLTQLSCFQGGWSVEAAEAVLDIQDPLAGLASLLDKSMVHRAYTHSVVRFTMFGCVREFVHARSDPQDTAAMERHADWAVSYAELWTPLVDTKPSAATALDREAKNLMVATRWLLAQRDRRAVPLLEGLWHVYHRTGRPEGLHDAFREALDTLGLDGPYLARLHLVLGRLRASLGDARGALVTMNCGLQVSGTTQRVEAELQHSMSLAHLDLGDAHSAMRFACQSQQSCRDHGWIDLEAHTENTVARSLAQLGRRDEAISHYKRSITLIEQAGNRRAAAQVWTNLGLSLSSMGHLDRAADCHRQAQGLAERFHDRSALYSVLVNLASDAAREGRFEEALQRYKELLEKDRRLGGRILRGATIVNAGFVALLAGDPTYSIALITQALHHQAKLNAAGTVHTLGLLYLTMAYTAVDDLVTAEIHLERAQAKPLATLTGDHQFQLLLAEAHVDLLRSTRAQIPAEAERFLSRTRECLAKNAPEATGDRRLYLAYLQSEFDRRAQS